MINSGTLSSGKGILAMQCEVTGGIPFTGEGRSRRKWRQDG
jgi:hypothetical protein